MLKTNEYLDKNVSVKILEVITDHSPALSTIPPQAIKRGYEVEISEIVATKLAEQAKEKKITKNLIPLIENSISKKGITEGFIIYEDDLNNNVKLTDIKHKLQKKEINFTSTGEKLDFHWPIFWKLKETNYSSIIRATLTLHQVCSSRCPFCSTINRNKKDSITLEEAKDFVKKLYIDQANFNKKNFTKYNDAYKKISGSDIRLKGLILSGGGQPNLWPHFSEFVEWLSTLDIDLGLITNGFPKNVDDKIYDKFKWIRLSITPEDASPFYPNQRFDLQRIPDNVLNSKSTFGLSYVYGPWTNDELLSRLILAPSFSTSLIPFRIISPLESTIK